MVSDVTLRKRLAAAVADMMTAAMETESRWGVDDCTLWAVEPIRRVLGYDPAVKGRGRYKTRIGAFRFLGKGGLPAAVRVVARRHRWKRIEPKKAKAGDIGLVEIDGRLTMAACRARGWFVARGDTGFVAFQAKQLRAAWSIL